MSFAEQSGPELADVSVALCTRNGARFIGEQLASILRQSPLPCEIVVGDDASTDDTVAQIHAAVADFRQKNPESALQVRLLQRDRPLGIVRNFEDTIRHCSGTLIALSDQDDVWPSGRLARLVPQFQDPRVGLVHTDARLVDERGADTGVRLLNALEASKSERRALVAGDAFGVLLRRNLVTGATVLVRRDLAVRAMPFPASWVHDEWLAIMAAVEGALRLVPEPWLDYRQHQANEIGAGEVTWSRRWARLREPRDDRARRLISRSQELLNRLERSGAEATLRERAHGKLAHEQSRSALPAWPPARIPGILLGLITGRYGRFSRGLIDVARDLVQPASGDRG